MRKRLSVLYAVAMWWGGVAAQGLIKTPEEQYLAARSEVVQVDISGLRYAGNDKVRDLIRTGTECDDLIVDKTTGSQYLALSDEFTATPLSPVVLRNGREVGRAFARNPDGSYDFILCSQDYGYLDNGLGVISVYMRRDIWEKYYSNVFKINSLKIFDRSSLLNVKSNGVDEELEIRSWVYTDFDKFVVDDALSSFADVRKRMIKRGKEALDERLKGEVGRKLQSAVLVDGQYYAPYGEINSQGEVVPYSDANYTLGKPFERIKVNDKEVEKFILIGKQPYVAAPFWTEFIFNDDYTFEKWIVYKTSDLNRWPVEKDRLAMQLTPPATPPTYQIISLRAAWITRVTTSTRERWLKYLEGGIRVNGMPMVKLANITPDYPMTVDGDRILQEQQVVARVFDPAAKVPAVRLNGEVYVPVTFVSGVQYDGPTDSLSAPHDRQFRATLDLKPLALKAVTLADLIRLETQRSDQARQAAEQQARVMQQQALAAQQAQQQAAAAARAQAQASAAASARAARLLAVAKQAAPGMTVIALGDDRFGGYKIKDHKLFIRIVQVKNEKVVASCDQQSLDRLVVLSVGGVRGADGLLFLSVSSPGYVARVTYALRANARLCSFMAQ